MTNEKTMGFVVPVHGESGLFLGRCLWSITENQDWPHKKVYVVFDGPDQMKIALKQEEIFKDNDSVCFIHHKKNQGAPAARNTGLKYFKLYENPVDYISFFDCDSILEAGGLRTWIQAFEDNPDCDFVYGGYRFRLEKNYNSGIASKEFDAWELTCNNYIASHNPIRIEKCIEWDENLKSLQDWDVFLRLSKSGSKGKLVKDWLVTTEPPSEGSISGHSHKNWIDSVHAVRSKNGIPDRTKVVTTTGAYFQSKRRAKFLDADYIEPDLLLMKPNNYKAIISMGYYIQSTPPAAAVFRNANGAKKIIHWIGTDALQLSLARYIDVKYFRENIDKVADHMFSNAPWLQKELEDMGLKTELLYCPIESGPYEVKPFPEKFTVAFYYSDSNPLHNEYFMIDVAKNTPDLKWKFFGPVKPATTDGFPKNIEFMGNIKDEDMPKFISSTSCIVRCTGHDGFPATLAEWSISGRPFICNLKDMPFGRYVDAVIREDTFIKDKENLINAIRNLQKNLFENFVDKDLAKARDYYIKLLDPNKYVKRMNEVCGE